MNTFQIPTYETLLDEYSKRLKKTKSLHAKVSLLRLAIFIAILLSWFYVFPSVHAGAGAIMGMLLIVAFMVFLKVHKNLEDKRNYLEAMIKTNANEIKCCNGDYSVFQSGAEFVDHNHPYSYDIDLFGDGSLFQYLNRSVTIKGKNLLAKWLRNTPLINADIVNNQKVVEELSTKLNFRQEFQVVGKLFASETEEEELVSSWINYPLFFTKRLFMLIFLWLLPLVNISVLALVIAGRFEITSLIWVIFINLTIIGSRHKKFNGYYGLLNRSHAVLRKTSRLVQMIEQLDCETEHALYLKSMLEKNEVHASSQINKLTKLLNGLDNRNNMLLGIILNSLLLWDWQYIFRIEKWRLNHKVDFSNWLECIANFDALISLANLSFNNPDFSFPAISEKEFELSAVQIGHPLLAKNVRICNDFSIDQSPRYAIVTGANMAGKSTFLRTIATNIVLAGCGASVCAEKLTFTPLPLHSSMRAEDSLMNNESYFFAELKRLQKITQELDKGKKLFIILDEILRGTNSEDKRKGSIGFVK
jgi:hypothetical protein